MYGYGNSLSNPPTFFPKVCRQIKMLHDHRHPPVTLIGARSRGEWIPVKHVVFPYTRQPALATAMNPASQFGSGTQSSSVNASHSPRGAGPAFRFAAGPRSRPFCPAHPRILLGHQHFDRRTAIVRNNHLVGTNGTKRLGTRGQPIQQHRASKSGRRHVGITTLIIEIQSYL